MKRTLFNVLIAAFLLGPFFSGAAARTWYVTLDGNGDAPTIQAAIDSTDPGDLILVAGGRYTWTNQGTNGEYGLIKFVNRVTGIELRSVSGPEVTILDAEQLGRVVYVMAYNDVVVDGFTFTGGVAPSFGNYQGGGIVAHLASPIFRNCIIRDNSADHGGGLHFSGVSSPIFENCRFLNNVANEGGGAYLVASSDIMLFNQCVFEGNYATDKGGGINCERALLWLIDCSISANLAGTTGGGLNCEIMWPSTMINCTMAENGAPNGGGIRVGISSSLKVLNTIISFSRSGSGLGLESGSALNVENSNIYGNASGDALPPGAVNQGGNFSLDPQFCGMLGSYYYYLQGDSPCAPGNHPDGIQCGKIGAYPVGCSLTPTREKTWGAIKALFGEE